MNIVQKPGVSNHFLLCSALRQDSSYFSSRAVCLILSVRAPRAGRIDSAARSFLFQQVIRNQCGEFSRLHHPLTGQEQLAMGKEVRRGVGLEGVALLNLAAAAWDMQDRKSVV